MLLKVCLLFFTLFFLFNLFPEFSVIVLILPFPLFLFPLDIGYQAELSLIGRLIWFDGGFRLFLIDFLLEFLAVRSFSLSSVIVSREEHLSVYK